LQVPSGWLAERFGPREFGRVWQAACGELAPLVSGLITRVSTGVEDRAADDAERTALRIALTHAVHGQFDAAWLPLYEAAGIACGLGRIARSAGFVWRECCGLIIRPSAPSPTPTRRGCRPPPTWRAAHRESHALCPYHPKASISFPYFSLVQRPELLMWLHERAI